MSLNAQQSLANVKQSLSRAWSLICDIAVGVKGWILGQDLDTIFRTPSKSDGVSVFTFLSTFALGQAAALVAVLNQKEEHQEIVLSVYFLFSLLTILSMTCVLRFTRIQTIGKDRLKKIAKKATKTKLTTDVQYVLSDGSSIVVRGKDKEITRAYDQNTIEFGRLLLRWILLIACVVLAFGLMGWLPGQTQRKVFHGEIVFEVTTTADKERLVRLISGGHDTLQAKSMTEFLDWFDAGFSSGDKDKKVVFVVQKENFDANYFAITLNISTSDKFQLGEPRVAFLVKNLGGGTEFKPVYRQLEFVKNQRNEELLNVAKPSEKERLFIALPLKRNNPKEEWPEPGGFGIKLSISK
jgi:hypothetical protein